MGDIDWAEILNAGEYAKLTVALFAVANPVGTIAVFLGMTSGMTKDGRNTVAQIVALVFLIVGLLFTFLGGAILEAFSISIDAFMIAGGLLVGATGLDMLRKPVEQEGAMAEAGADPLSISIVPLGIPMIAGPGAMSTVIVFSEIHEGREHLALVIASIVAVALSVWGIFRLASVIGPLMGARAALTLHRVMGLIVLSMGIEFVIDGVGGHFVELTVVER